MPKKELISPKSNTSLHPVCETLGELVNHPCIGNLKPYKVKVGNIIKYTYAKTKRLALRNILDEVVQITECTVHDIVCAAKNAPKY